MYKTVEINTIEDLKREVLFDNEYDPNIGRYRSHLFVYRGLPNSSFNLQTSLERNCKDSKHAVEVNMLNNFAKYAELEMPSINDSIWKKMIVGQHHGLPTRLLDWSRSPLMSLHFATSGESMDDMDQHDCLLWRIDVVKFHERLPEKYREVISRHHQNVFTIDMLKECCDSVDEYDQDMGSKYMVMLEPPTIDIRIANQYSFFSIFPSNIQKGEEILEQYGEDVVTKFIINRNIRWQIRDMLDQANVNERIVYPGLNGIATWLGRHYFVRRITNLQIRTMDITKLDVDVIVNPDGVKGGSTVSTSIFDTAGDELEKEYQGMKDTQIGDIKTTKGYKLKAKHIFHVHVPTNKTEDYYEQLEYVYKEIIKKAVEHEYHSIGIPLIGAGRVGKEKGELWKHALKVCNDYLNANKGEPLNITFCIIDEKEAQHGENILKQIQEGIKEEEINLEYKNHFANEK